LWDNAGRSEEEAAIVERLRSKDTQEVLKFLRDLYALREKDAFTSHLVSSLPGLIQADIYTYNEMDQARGEASYKLWPDDFTPIKDAAEILGRFAPQIPMHAHWEHGDGQALKISDFLSPCAFRFSWASRYQSIANASLPSGLTEAAQTLLSESVRS
jgi:hypothetical protein